MQELSGRWPTLHNSILLLSLPKITLVSTGGWIIWVLTKTEIQASALTDPASLVRTQVYLPSSDDLKKKCQKIRENVWYDFFPKLEIIDIQKQTITDVQCGNSWQSRAVGRSENPGVPVLFGGHNLPALVEIGLTDLPKYGGGTPGTPGNKVKHGDKELYVHCKIVH